MKKAEVRETLFHLSGGDHNLWEMRLAIFRDHKKILGHKIRTVHAHGHTSYIMPVEPVGYIRVKKYDHL